MGPKGYAWRVAATALLVGLALGVSSGGAAGTTCNGLTATIVGTTGNDTLVGTAGNDVIAALAGDDTIDGAGGDGGGRGGARPGGGGRGGRGRAAPHGGGNGNDTLVGGGGVDTVSYKSATAAVTVDLGAGTGTGGAGTDALSGFVNATGSTKNDTLIGDDSANKLDGSSGTDTCQLKNGV